MRSVFNVFIIGLIGLSFQSYGSSGANLTKASEFANQLYENCPEHLDPNLKYSILEIVERVSIIESAEENLPLISSYEIKSKCLSNTDLLENFNPETFNYFLYYIDFELGSIQKIRIDETDYILEILPFNN